MKRLLAASVAALALVGCDPKIPTNPTPPTVITARLDLTATPPVVPAPNDLATDPKTGLLNIPLPDTASAADQEFAAYLDTLNGYPSSASAATTFDGKLSAASVTTDSVKVIDITNANAAVAGVTVGYVDTGDTTAPGAINVAPPATGWVPGHTYGIAVVAGSGGVKGGNGESVVASANWALLRAANSLVSCSATQGCQASTALIPSTETDPVKRQADTLAKAQQLEALRLKYKPMLDALDAAGTKRSDVVIGWSFKVSDDTKMGFYPTNAPPIVPTPNDLAIDPATGLVNAPVDPSAPAGYQEFTKDYLNTLNGFPVASSGAAEVLLGDLDASTVSPTNVLVFNALDGTPLLATIAYVPAAGGQPGMITISPPTEGWAKSIKVAIAVTSGVHRADGNPVVGSEVWAMARSASTLVSCSDLTSPDCKPVITLAPLSAAQAVQLEALRRGYKPLLDALDAQGVARADVPLLWVFSTVNQPEATFDPANGVIPFPNDLVYDQTNNHLNLPVPAGAPAALQQLIAGLNTLDGFSTTAPSVSENADGKGVIDIGSLDPATLDAGTMFIPLQAATGALPPNVQVCLNCRSSTDSTGATFVPLADGGVISPAPDQLQFVPLTPLNEKERYAAVLTTDLKDTTGRTVMASPTFALIRSKASLLDNGHSVIPGVSDAQATQLEALRAGYSQLFDFLEAAGLPRKKVALLWTFKTQSTVSTATVMNAAPAAISAPTGVAMAVNASATVFPQMDAAGLARANLGGVFVGNLSMPFALTGPGATLNPNPAQWVTRRIPYVLTIPSSAAPTNGWPVVIFGHGLGRQRTDMLGFANAAAAAGYATIAIDEAWHGDRTTCIGFGAYLTQTMGGGPYPDDAACANPTTMMCCNDPAAACATAAGSYGRCVGRAAGAACTPGATDPAGDIQCLQVGQGLCQANGTCENGTLKTDASGVVSASGWNFFSLSNFFATRDSFRNPVIDFAQLVRVLKDTSAGGLNAWIKIPSVGGNAAYNLDASTIDYVGQSLGTFAGNHAAAVNTSLRHVGLNVPGSDQVLLLMQSPTLVPYRNAFEAQLAPLGLVPGTPGFVSFLVLAKTIVDPGDPQNSAYATVNSSAAGRETYYQYIQDDQFLINPTTLEAIAAGSRGAKQPQVFEFVPPAGYTLSKRHGFFLDPTGDMNWATDCNPATAGFPMNCLTAQAQIKMATFIATGTAP